MESASKKLIIVSMAVAAVVALAAVLDIVTKFPFARKISMDAMFLVAAALVLYMGYDAYRDLG